MNKNTVTQTKIITGVPSLTYDVRSFCEKIEPTQTPLFLSIHAEANAQFNDCFNIVKARIEKDGGEIQYGWQIWETPQIMIEAEFHAVWKSPTGMLLDITPKNLPTDKILFLPSEKTKYEGKQINSIRRPISASPLVREYIDLNDRIFEIINEGDLAYVTGAISLPAHVIQPLRSRKLELQNIFAGWQRSKTGRNDSCFCGSGQKFKKCCGRSY
jgi:hypothetical protein